MKVEKIDHIHIAVKGLEKAIKFFSDILGTKFSQTIFAEKFDLKSVLAPPWDWSLSSQLHQKE